MILYDVLNWTNQIGLASVLTWLFLLASLVVAILTIRSKLYVTEHDRRVQLEDELKREQEVRHQLRAELAAEKMKTELTPVLEGITAGFEIMKNDSDQRLEAAIENISRTIREEFSKHEDRAQDRHDASVAVLQEMAASLRDAA